jgi:hypothetical protein
VLRTIDASPVGAALVAYLTAVPSGFNGMLTELLDRLERYRPHGEGWPRSGKGLGDALRRLAPALRLIGFECKREDKTGGVIRWRIFPKRQPADPFPPGPESPDQSAATTPNPVGPSGSAGHAGRSGHEVGSQAPRTGVPPSPGEAHADDGEVF